MLGQHGIEDLAQVVHRRIFETITQLGLEGPEHPGRESFHEVRKAGDRSLP